MIALNRNFLRGSYPPLVTPFRDGAVDYDVYARMVERQIGEGSHGIVVNGTTAEPSTLSVAERNELVRVAVASARGRIAVVAATGSQSHADTIELTAAAEEAGADAVLIVTPYFIRPSQRGLVEYYADIAGRTRLPMLIYHIPGRAAVNVEASTVEQIAERAPNLVGMKHAANDLALVTRLLARMGGDFRIFVGLEELSFPMLAIGACGLMNAAGNLKPRAFAQMCADVFAGRLEPARAAHDALFELNQAIFFDTNPTPLKYMMHRVGLLEREEHRLPMMPAAPELAARLDGVLARAGLIDAKS
ncbi:MAG TPA: 4-hydroxy-tetrahydrodipicolinate synthase [Candidatus Binataceae bacterium]|nr:4-hydroxy-tetrahydrodipicolinate synthase [Candidatus Binataceae bacterium]